MSKRLAIALIAMVAILLAAFSDLWPSQTVKVWVFDIGQGDAIFIDGPHKQVLIDGGPDALVLERLSSVMPWWDRSIDIVVNTHPHADHLVGLLPVLERYKVDQVIDADQGYNTPEFDEYLRLIEAEGAIHTLTSGGDTFDLGNDARLLTIWPSEPFNREIFNDPNDGSVVMEFTYQSTSMLLTGDAGVEQEQFWEASDIDILKVGHHGSDTSTSQVLLDAVKPEVAIMSVGEGNDYGHPSPFVVDRLQGAGTEVYRTDLDGNILIKFGQNDYLVKPKTF